MRAGLDVGGTKVDAVALAADGSVSARVRLQTTRGADGVIDTITRAISALAAEADVCIDAITSVGIGIPGVVEPGTTILRHAVNLDVGELDLARAFAGALAAPIRIENDVKAAAVGAAVLRGGDASMAYLNLGTGIAAGIVVDGLLWAGARGGAGEVGHLSVDPAGPECRCGQRGCVEAFSGGRSVARRWGSGAPLPVLDLFDAADAGDSRASALRDDLARGVAAAVRALVLTVDVETVVLGGGLTALGERLVDPVRSRLRSEAGRSAFLASLDLDERIEVLPTGSPAAALGAALIGAGSHVKGVLAHG